MSASSEIDLTGPQRDALRRVFGAFGGDVDLVVYGRLKPREAAALRLALEDSDLSIFAHVVAYDSIDHPPLKPQIDHWMRPLFTRNDLDVAKAAYA